MTPTSDRIVVITGASSGIGAALAELLASRGMSIVLAARRQPALEEVSARCGGRASVYAADVSVRAQVRALADDTIKRLGRFDVWINNAGVGISRLPSELTDEDVDLMMQINVKSVLYGMQETLPHFKARNEGHVINVSSMLGRVPFATIRSAYSGAKHFMNALSAMMRDEIRQTHPGIQISLVSPGVVRTDFGLRAVHGGPDSRQFPASQSAEEVAAVIASVIDSRAPDVYTFKGARDLVAGYYSSAGQDPS
jgi:NADP-dependent 3-hydroxy acid dehydrogenase YdfG